MTSMNCDENIPYGTLDEIFKTDLKQEMQSQVRSLTTICGAAWLSGMIIFTISEWVHTDPASQENIHVTITVLSWTGIILFITGVYGYWGALHVQHPLIYAFTLILLACSVVQICCGAIFFTFIGESVRDDTMDQVREASSEYTKFFRLQKEYSCCGAKSYKDWIDTAWWKREREALSDLVIPDSCCIETGCNKGLPPYSNLTNTDSVHQTGCSEIVVGRRSMHFWVIGTSSLAEGFFLLTIYFYIHYLVNIIVKLELGYHFE